LIDVLPSKRLGIYYLEYCRVSQLDERVVYNRSLKGVTQFFSIPEQNTSVILLGSGTSITQAAIRQLGDAGVMVGVTGGGGTPLFMGSLSEYRPNEYFHQFLPIWMDNEKRFAMAKRLAAFRVEFVRKSWSKLDLLNDRVEDASGSFLHNIKKAKDNNQLLGFEANFAKQLYAIQSQHLNIRFAREAGKKDESDVFNSYIDNGNYLAYGLASVCLWTLGIPFQMAVNHGMTRRGALVFDVADMIKDGVILPNAMLSAHEGEPRSKMRKKCIRAMHDTDALTFLFKSFKSSLEDVS